MSGSYDEASETLFQSPHEAFVAERQRLAAELKAAGDLLGAKRLSKLARPSISAWAVNQLWWRARADFARMFETAEQLRAGELAARGAHRQALAKLGARARELLSEGGHAASEATLRRVETTLAGLAAAGGFEPETAGALTKDRDPPGFEALGEVSWAASAQPASKAEQEPSARAREQALAEQRRIAEERAKQQAAARRLEAELRDAQRELSTAEHERDRIARELAAAEREVERARAVVEAAEARLASAENEA